MSQNVAEGNGDDGFRISIDHFTALPRPVTVANNYAIFNRGKGLHVAAERGVEFDTPQRTISGNTAIRNQGGDLADDTACRWTRWQANHFGTAFPACVQ